MAFSSISPRIANTNLEAEVSNSKASQNHWAPAQVCQSRNESLDPTR